MKTSMQTDIAKLINKHYYEWALVIAIVLLSKQYPKYAKLFYILAFIPARILRLVDKLRMFFSNMKAKQL